MDGKLTELMEKIDPIFNHNYHGIFQCCKRRWVNQTHAICNAAIKAKQQM